ncbi:kda protein in nof-fb transposable element, partial [Lasius niger]
MNTSFLDHSYSSMSTLKTDLASSSNLNEESGSIPSTHLVLKSKKLEACQSEKKKISKYFKAYPEIRQRNVLVGQKKKSALLPHGSLPPPIKIKDNKGQTKSYSVANTCAFDSIVHVLMTGAIDDVNYCAYLEASGNPTLRLVYDFIHKGLTQNVLRQRVLILKTYYACKPL